MSELRGEVVRVRSSLPTVACLLNPALKMRHLEAIAQATATAGSPSSSSSSSSLDRGRLTISQLEELKVT